MARSLLLPIVAAAAASVALAACIPSIPGNLDQAGGSAPLVADLDTSTVPLQIGTYTSGFQSVINLRGPNKGAGERGGMTASFVGDGGSYCVIIDPGNSWESPAPGGDPLATLDDADSDLFVGRAADYTGTPGVKIGDFRADYVDSLGVRHDIDANQCIQTDRNTNTGAHSGAGTPEFCAIDTEAGVPYIVLAETIAAAPATQIDKLAVAVITGNCPSPITENTLTGDNTP